MNNGNSEKAKRQRVALACEGCRQRKIKCDGNQPICGICMKRKIPCVYGKKYTRAHVSVDYVRSLEEKLGISEKTVHSDNLNDNESDTKESTKKSHIYDPIADSRSNYEGTDAMGAGGAEVVHKGVFGSSAAMSFMNELYSSVNGKTDDIEPEKCMTYKMSRSPQERTVIDFSKIVLPSKAISDEYIKNYFDYAYPLYPFIHKPTFMRTYEEMWLETKPPIDELFYCILNIVFAFGYRLSPFGQTLEENVTANFYFERSQQYLKFHFMDSGSLLLIQALLLTGQFLQGTTGLAGCWNIVGLAIRMSQGLGLHMEKAISNRRSYIEQEMEKRLWHGCLLMDKIVSMTFGRPLMVVEAHSDSPDYIDDEYVFDTSCEATSLQSNGCAKPSVLSFFEQTVKLYDILADIMKFFYSDHNPDYVDLFVSIFRYQEKLIDFHNNIPSHIKFGSSLMESPYQRQSIILQIRYLHLKITLYRPILFPRHKDKNNHIKENYAELYVSSQRSISVLCVETAIELINLISEYKAADITLLPAVWYNNFYIYTATTVLLAASLQPCIKQEIDTQKFDSAWKTGIELLESYKSQSDSAGRCLKVLLMMHEKISNKIQQKDNQNQIEYKNQPDISPTEVTSDLLLSFMYETAGPFVDPFTYSADVERFFETVS